MTDLLYDNRPNPFTRETTLRFRLAQAGRTRLSIYDPAGRLVRSLLSGAISGGEHTVAWDGRDELGNRSAAGLYFYVLKTEGGKMQRKMLMIR